jgi:predicted membrane channel-forming protein YqfA (hemolysin III family)
MKNDLDDNNQEANFNTKKDLVDYVGINGLFIVSITTFALFSGSILAMLGTICGIAGVIYLIKRRKKLTNKDKYIGWGLFLLWLIVWMFVASGGSN